MLILAAMLLDCFFGDPEWLTHPVALIGRLIGFFEERLYPRTQEERRTARLRGCALCAGVIAVTAACAAAVLAAAGLVSRYLRIAAEVYLLFAALAYKSLKDEAASVARRLAAGDLPGARRQVGRIVGRDTARLDAPGVVRAAVESVAESYVDGVASVLFWMAVGDCFGCAAVCVWVFKAASTMDSMIGYDDERYHDFGFCAAKLDDALNFIPARLGALISIGAGALIGMDWRRAWRIFLRDRLNHKSPNSAHAESVFAGLLGIRLGGGAYYGGEWEGRPYLGDDLREPEAEDIMRANHIMSVSAAICAVLIFAMARLGL